MTNQFEVGDIAIKRYGTRPFRIIQVDKRWSYSGTIVGVFLHNGNRVYCSPKDIIHYDGATEEGAPKLNTLYSFQDDDGKTLFGTHVGTNSQSLFILEVKGKDQYYVRDPKDLEEVLPYTFSVNSGGKEIHYMGEPGKLSEGDWLIQEAEGGFSIVQVKAVDTKSKKARSQFNGRRIITEANQ